MPLSSNSLIHLTKRKDSLISILQDEFKIHYCLERVCIEYEPIKNFTAAIPMVSFCDIPLSEIKNHIKNYGSYGIGLKKEWAEEKGLNPVLYIEEKSTVGKHLFDSFNLLVKKKGLNNLSDEDAALFDVLRYLKNYEYDLERNGKTIEGYRFSDEREWRYVPPQSDAYFMYVENQYSTEEQKENKNKQISSLRLGFEPDDITYIIIKEESEITEFIDVLRSAKGKNFPLDQVERLITRIITVDQLKSDF